MIDRERINVVWLKRDLRLKDNEAIANALKSEKRTLLLYVFEPLLLNDDHYSQRHFNFIKESVRDINLKLEAFNSKVLSVTCDIQSAFNLIQEFFKVDAMNALIKWGIFGTVALIGSCMLKLFSWMQMDKKAIIREIKRLELQVSSLSGKISE